MKVFEATQDLVRAFRKLRLAMRRCRECEHLDGCPAIRHFHQSIDIALEELVDEWGLNER